MTLNIKATDFCDVSNSAEGVIKAINELQNGDSLVFPKNEYHFYKEYCIHKVCHMTNTDSFKAPDKYFAVLIENKENITVDGCGSTLVIHGDMCAFSLRGCKNVRLVNFTVRYASPTNFEMEVVERLLNKITYKIPTGSDFEVKNNKLTFFEKSPFSGENYYTYTANGECYCNVIHRGDDVFRTSRSPTKTALKIKKTGAHTVECRYFMSPKFKVGDVVAMSRNKLRDNCGLFFESCSDIFCERITVNYMHGFGWLSQMCENLSFDKLTFKPASGYRVSSFADLIHVCGCKGYVKITDSHFEHPHDDAINVHGAFLRLRKACDERTAELEFVHHQQGGYKAFYPGDKVKIYSRTDLSELDGVYTVDSTDDNIDKKTVIVKFKEKLPPMKPEMYVFENITYNPNLTVSGCTFNAIPTRGILCTTDKESEIFGNTFRSVGMPDIYISCDCRDWYESGPCRNMKIHDNTFSKKDPIKFEPICLLKPVKDVHRNVLIYDNIIAE
jgi:hypothetical protein